MKDNTWPLINGRTAWLAGVNWVPVPARLSKNIKRLARRRGADRFVTYFYQTQQGEREYVAGLINLASLGKAGQSVKVIYALALLVTPTLDRCGYAIISLAPDLYTFVGCVDGVLMNDIIGDKQAMEQARQTFIQFNPEPDTGWRCYAPAEFALEGSGVFDLDRLLSAGNPPASARFQSVSAKKPLAGLITLAVVLLCSGYGWQQYAGNQEARRLKAAHETWLQSREAAVQITAPWETGPGIKNFVTACSQHWQSAPLTLAGWLFSEAECTQLEGTQGRIRLAYTRPDGGTVGDFVLRVKQHFGSDYSPFFNVPGPGDRGGYTEAVEFHAGQGTDNRPLPNAEVQVQRLTTFAQQTRLPFTFTEENNRMTSESGLETLLPWRVFNLSLKTDIPPALLFSSLDDTGVQLNSIRLSLNQGRLTYQIEGKFYGQP